MCGRFTITVSKEELKDYAKSQYDIDDLGNEYDIPNFNVAPGTNIISVIHDGKKHRIGLLEWGFVPPFTMKEQVGFINAKSETLFDKPSFRNAALKQRCVILADGFYNGKWITNNRCESKQMARCFLWLNLITIVATFIGLYVGLYLYRAVILTVEPTILFLNRDLTWKGYLIAGILTLLFGYLVNQVMKPKIRKIDMIGSLKSNE